MVYRGIPILWRGESYATDQI